MTLPKKCSKLDAPTFPPKSADTAMFYFKYSCFNANISFLTVKRKSNERGFSNSCLERNKAFQLGMRELNKRDGFRLQ